MPTKVYHKQLEETPNIEFYWNTTVSEFLYDKKLTGAKLHNVKTGEDTEISVDGAFISIGRKPASELFEGILDMDEAGYIVATNLQEQIYRVYLPSEMSVQRHFVRL